MTATIRDDPQEYFERYQRYLEHLRGIADHTAVAALQLARTGCHQDPQDHRSIKCATLKAWRIDEHWLYDANSGRSQLRGSLELNGAGGAHLLRLLYWDIQGYELANPTLLAQRSGRTSHGQLLIDEFDFSAADQVTHHLLWDNQARWSITCRDVRFLCEPK